MTHANRTATAQRQDILTIREAARLLRIHAMTLYKLARMGQVPTKKIGGQWRFSRQQLIAWVEQEMAAHVHR